MAGLLVGVAEWEVASWEGTGSGVAVAGGDESGSGHVAAVV